MAKYSGPKERLVAAQSIGTSLQELAELAKSEFEFVRLAVARNPSANEQILASLIPESLESYDSQQIAEAIAQRADASAELLASLAKSLQQHLHAGRENSVAVSAAIKLCNHPRVRLQDVIGLISPDTSTTLFRKIIARECRSIAVLEYLAKDRSSVVAERAKKSIALIGSAQ
ncbi:MAG: hypothetical protein JNM76_01575 [Betaproteobacteria bacterium]|nr:hypothetical protein [Betaproteobacteria bacterium]